MASKIAAVLVFILLAVPLLSAAFSDFEDRWGKAFKNRMDGWIGLASLAILASLFFNVLAYMAGYALEAESLKRYAKSEFMEVTASSLMIFFAVALIYEMSGSALSFMGDIIGTSSHISCAAASGGKFVIWNDNGKFGSGPLGAFKCKVQEKITALDRQWDNIFKANKAAEMRNSVCISIFGVPVYCWDWNQAMHNEVEENHYVATKIVSLLVPLHAQYALAEYIQNNMLTVFLPIGLVLRIFPFTRGVGGLFIALGVGFFFVFPTFFLLTDPTFVKANEPQEDRLGGVCYTGFKGAAVLLGGASGTQASTDSALQSSSGRELVYQATVGTVFYPFVALAITLIFVRAVTPLLGGDLGELMRMVSRLG